MGGLLHNARRFFRGFTPAPRAGAQRFAVSCSEGHRLTGVRTEGYQALRCPTCGEGLFVLPRSPLPEPSPPSAARADPEAVGKGPASPWADEPVPLSDPVPSRDDAPAAPDDPGEADDQIEWVDESAPAPLLVPGPSPEELAAAEIAAAEARPPAARTARARRRSPGASEGGRTVEVAAPPLSPGERLRRYRNPLIFAGVALVVAATVAVRIWRNELQDLPRVAEAGRVEGIAALDEGKFDRAHQLLAPAKRAVRRLGGEVQGAAAIVQAADEAAVLVGLCTSRLEEILDEAYRADDKKWPETFAKLYKGRTVVLDELMREVPDVQGDGRYDLDYRIFPDGEGAEPPARGRIDLTGFKLFELVKPRKGEPVRFGARLASFRYDSRSGEWLVGLEPDSGVIMTHQKALDALGWPADETAAEDRP